MSTRLSALVIWTLVAAAAVFWSLRLLAQPQRVPVTARLATAAPPVSADWSRLLGTPPKPAEAVAVLPAMASRFRLTGVAAQRTGGVSAVGVALIAVDGKPPRAVRVGQRIDGELFLQSVDLRTASIGPQQGAAALVLEVPPLVAAATGTLASLSALNPAVPPPPPAPPSPPPAPPAVAAPPPIPGAAANATPVSAENPAPPQVPDLRGNPVAR